MLIPKITITQPRARTIKNNYDYNQCFHLMKIILSSMTEKQMRSMKIKIIMIMVISPTISSLSSLSLKMFLKLVLSPWWRVLQQCCNEASKIFKASRILGRRL